MSQAQHLRSKHGDRRTLLRTVAPLLAMAIAVLWPTGLARSEPDVPSSIIGTSQGGEPLVVYHVGEGATRVFILGGQHGGPERNTIALVWMLLSHFAEDPSALPPGIALDIMPVANPDGVAMGTRQYASGVDPNRNWGGPDWESDAYDSNGRFREGLGGPEPLSEPETRALAEWILNTRPALVINYHSAGGFMFGGGGDLGAELAQAYSEASGYPRPVPGGGSRSPLTYRATGSMNLWLRQVDIPGLLIELSTPYVTEFERNLRGIRAVLALLATARDQTSIASHSD